MVAHYIRVFAMQLSLKIKGKDPSTSGFLVALMDMLEKEKEAPRKELKLERDNSAKWQKMYLEQIKATSAAAESGRNGAIGRNRQNGRGDGPFRASRLQGRAAEESRRQNAFASARRGCSLAGGRASAGFGAGGWLAFAGWLASKTRPIDSRTRLV